MFLEGEYTPSPDSVHPVIFFTSEPVCLGGAVAGTGLTVWCGDYPESQRAIPRPATKPLVAIMSLQPPLLEVLGMPRERRYTAHLPPANVTDRLLRRIDEAIPELLRDNLSWDVGIGDDTIKAERINDFLAEISGERRFDELNLEALDNEEDSSFWELYGIVALVEGRIASTRSF